MPTSIGATCKNLAQISAIMPVAKSPNRGKIKGRGAEPKGRFVRLDSNLIDSPAYSSLSPNARSLLVELARLENGKNNGNLFLSEEDAAARMGLSCRKAARKAFDELIHGGFIKMTSDAFFSVKTGQGRARSWALSWLYNQNDRLPATFAFRDFRPSDRVAIQRMDRRQDAIKRLTRQWQN